MGRGLIRLAYCVRGTEEERVEEMGEDLPGSGDMLTHTPEKEVVPGGVLPTGRPEWEVLSPSQIDLIEEPQLKGQILEYRTYRERQRQASRAQQRVAAVAVRVKNHHQLRAPP